MYLDVRVHLKLTDLIPIHRSEIDMASTTLKQDEDEDDLNRNKAASPDPKKPTSLPYKHIEVIRYAFVK